MMSRPLKREPLFGMCWIGVPAFWRILTKRTWTSSRILAFARDRCLLQQILPCQTRWLVVTYSDLITPQRCLMQGIFSSEMSRTSSADSLEKRTCWKGQNSGTQGPVNSRAETMRPHGAWRNEEPQRVLKAPFFKSWEAVRLSSAVAHKRLP